MGRFRWALVLVVVLIFPCIAFAVPQLINYQGELHDGSGNPINGDYNITFTIYNAPTGGDVLWTETQTVTVTDGVFNVLLGSQNPILANTFDGNGRYLGVKVDTDAEMTPRQQLASVPYALTAGCIPGDEVVCYTGDPVTRGVGECANGVRICAQDGTFGACVGEVTPVTEVCNDGLDNDCDGQTDNGCPVHYIFATSGYYQGDFGGLSGGDAICQSQGDSGSFTASLGATWTAVLSAGSTDARNRLPSSYPVHNTHGDLVANNTLPEPGGLWSGTLFNPVGYDQNGASVIGNVWTGTIASGSNSGLNCTNWSSLSLVSGSMGDAGSTDFFWVDSGISACGNANHLYCISSQVTLQ